MAIYYGPATGRIKVYCRRTRPVPGEDGHLPMMGDASNGFFRSCGLEHRGAICPLSMGRAAGYTDGYAGGRTAE